MKGTEKEGKKTGQRKNITNFLLQYMLPTSPLALAYFLAIAVLLNEVSINSFFLRNLINIAIQQT